MKKSTIFLLVISLIALSRWTKNIDFWGYWYTARATVDSGFTQINYPTVKARIGDYFQSPTMTVLLAPLAKLPFSVAKALWSLLFYVGLLAFARHYGIARLGWSHALFIVLLFAHPLSDVFLSGNITTLLLLALFFGWRLLHRHETHWQCIGAVLFVLPAFIKILPGFWFLFFLLRRDWRRVAQLSAAALLLVALTASFFGSHTVELFRAWLHAVGIYDQAAYPNWVAFQGPASIVYRWLEATQLFTLAQLFTIEKIFCMLLLLLCGWKALHTAQASLPATRKSDLILVWILFSQYVSSPFSWVCTLLLSLPLILVAFEMTIPRGAWIAVIVLALLPKDLWPAKVWESLAYWSAPGLCIVAVHALALRKFLDLDSTPA